MRRRIALAGLLGARALSYVVPNRTVADEAEAIYTDELKSYLGIEDDDTRHETGTTPSTSGGSATCNSIEGVWSLFTRSIVADDQSPTTADSTHNHEKTRPSSRVVEWVPSWGALTIETTLVITQSAMRPAYGIADCPAYILGSDTPLHDGAVHTRLLLLEYLLMLRLAGGVCVT